jgi:predicted outer membrane repeat protein
MQAMLSGLLVVGSAATGGAVDRFVAPSGSDTSNDCLSSATPCRTIQQAVSQAAGGDTIEIAKGQYRGPVRIGATSTTLTLLGGWAVDFGMRDVQANTTFVKGGTPGPVFDVTAGAGNAVDVTLDGLTISNSTSSPCSGFCGPGRKLPGIYAADTGDGSLTLTVSHCALRASRGGAVYANRDFSGGPSLQLTVADSTLKGNRTERVGGGIRIYGPVALTVTRSVFVRNRAQEGGGAISVEGSGSLTVTDSTFLRNKAVSPGISLQGGGAVAIVTGSSSLVTMTNTLFAGNTAKGYGGALWMTYAGSLDMTNCTLTRNATKMNGGGLYLDSVAGALTNTIVWGNKAAVGTDVWAGNTTLDLDHDDIGELTTDATVVNDLGGNINTDPLLVAPPNDLHLAAGSPCIDAGTCTGAPTTDIDGDPRPSGAGCDIGADEFVP